jgi:acylphosphatase
MPKPEVNHCCIHAVVTGRVQGVWYRAFVREQAAAKGVTGWAKNQADGSVDVMLCGENNAVQQVLSTLKEGPPLSEVAKVSHGLLPWQQYDGFITG